MILCTVQYTALLLSIGPMHYSFLIQVRASSAETLRFLVVREF